MIQMEREDNIKNEVENLKRNPHLATKVVSLLDRSGDPVILDRLQLEEAYLKCQELQEVVARQNEEKRVLTDQDKLAEERRDRIFTENLKMTYEKNNLISELNEKIKELKDKNMESERVAEVFLEKCTCLETKIAEMDQELEDSRQRKSELDQVVKELKLANKTIQELKWEKIESEKKAGLLESTLENSSKRISKLDQNHATSEVGLNLDSEGLRVKKENSSRDVDAEVVVVDALLPANGSSNNGLSKKGARNSVKPRTIEDIYKAHKVRTGKQSGDNPQEENHEPKEPLGSGAHIGGMQLLSPSHKSSRSSPPAAAGNIIDIIDSDDEIEADGVSCFVLQPEAVIEAVKQPASREHKKRISEEPNETDVASKRKKPSPEKKALPAEKSVPPSNEKESDNDAFQSGRPIQIPAPMKKRLSPGKDDDPKTIENVKTKKNETSLKKEKLDDDQIYHSSASETESSTPTMSPTLTPAAKASTSAVVDRRTPPRVEIYIEGGTFLSDTKVNVSTVIREIIEARIHPKGYTFAKIPVSHRLLYWIEFKRRFCWDTTQYTDSEIHRNFMSTLKRRYSSRMSEWRQKWAKDKVRPRCVREEVWRSWLEIFESDDYREKSERSSRNRMSEPNGVGTGISKHVGGSRSTIKHAKELSKELGRPATSLDVAKRLHVKKDGTPTSQRAHQLITTVEEAVEERRASMQDEPDVDEIYMSIVSKKKNRVFGTGSFGKLMTTGVASSSGQKGTEERIREAVLEEYKHRQEEAERRNAEERAQLEKSLQATIAAMEARMQAQIARTLQQQQQPPPPSPS